MDEHEEDSDDEKEAEEDELEKSFASCVGELDEDEYPDLLPSGDEDDEGFDDSDEEYDPREDRDSEDDHALSRLIDELNDSQQRLSDEELEELAEKFRA